MFYYHVILGAYGQWLRGDKRGWRERHHRIHVDGDYKNPPDPEFAQPIEKYSRTLLKTKPTVFCGNMRKVIMQALIDKFGEQGVKVLAVSIGRVHVHLLAKFPSNDIRKITGMAKKNATFELRKIDHDGPEWSKRSGVHPIKDEMHIHNTWRYIINHQNMGADVWYVLLES